MTFERFVHALEVAPLLLLLPLVILLFSLVHFLVESVRDAYGVGFGVFLIPGPNMIKPYEFGGVP